MPSKEFQKQGEQRHDDEVALANAEISDKTKIFWSRAKKLSIANFRKAEYSGGILITPEQSLDFYDHVRTTEDQEKIDFIRSSNAFNCGDCREVKTMAEAQKLTAQQNAAKGVKHIHAEDVSSTVIELT